MSRAARLAGALFLLVAPLIAQESDPERLSGVEKLTTVLARVSEAQTGATTISARFEQRKESRLLLEPSVSRGRFYFSAPDKVRWEYEAPRAMSVVLAGGVALTYRPEEARAERIEVGRMQRKVFGFLTATEPLDRLTRYFAVTLRDPGDARDYVIELEPTAYQLKKRLASVSVSIDRARYLPVSVTYVERDGDSTAFAFHDIVVDGPLPEGIFSIEMPEGVEVVEMKMRGR